MKKIVAIIFICLLSFCTSKNENKPAQTDSPEEGTINISVDETFKPAIEEELKVYKSEYPNANIIVNYKSEADCFKDLLKDSARLIIVSRGLTNNESEYFNSKLSFYPQYGLLAYDAIAAIVNINNNDSVFTLNDLENILSGKEKYTAILDGTNATSTVKYLQDSILKGKPFGANVVAVNGSDAVIEAIKKTPNAIGFVGNSWVSNGYDTKQLQNLKQMKLALIECKGCEEKGYFAKASQATLMYGQYPLARPLYFIVKEKWLGLGTGFTNFLSFERGQLIFRRSNLVPAKMNFNKRQSKIKE
ncbi:MAG: PstS family phosphate ABC transporter substrate-binding protein [Chitinophagaceae bacterium]